MNLKLFENDQQLVHGEVTIADSLMPPAAWGTYSIRLPNDSLPQDKLVQIKVILWSCMDRRIVRPLFDNLIKDGYAENEILTVSMGGGPLQVGEDRIQAIKTAFMELQTKLPNVQKIVAVAHTGICGGLKHFCGGIPITEAVKVEFKAQAVEKGVNLEVYLTDLILENCLSLLPNSWQIKTHLNIAEPDETSKTVRIHPHESHATYTLSEIVDGHESQYA